MSDTHAPTSKISFPGTEFIVALYSMTLEQRQAASATRAAARYGLPIEECQWWIEEARRCPEVWPVK